MKKFIKSLIPPILLKACQSTPEKPKAYKTYDEALNDCPKEAYEAEDIVKVIVEKNIIFKKSVEKNPDFDLGALRTLIGIGVAKSSNLLRVIDFGGGGGYHYTIAKTALGKDFDLRWNVVETPAMAREAQRMSNSKLKFFDTIEAAHTDLGVVDLVFTSGALHYCPQPLIFLEKLIAIKATYLFITRTSFNDADEQIANVQKSMLSWNGPGPLPEGFADRAVYYPNVFVPKSRVEQLLSKSYEIRFRTNEDRSAYTVGDMEIHMYGYFCVLRG